MTLFEAQTGGEFDQNFSKKSNAPGFARRGGMGGFGINRYITYSVTKIIQTCLPRIGQFFDTMIVASTDKEW